MTATFLGIPELQKMHAEMKHTSAQLSAMLVRQLKRKDRRRAKMRRNCDVVTAILQAASQKRSKIYYIFSLI